MVRVPVLVVLEFVLEFVVIVKVVVGLAVQVGQSARTFPEQSIVVALLEFTRFAEPARSSFSGHVVTCLGVVTTIMPR
jgi:hypothetical protein